MKKIYTIPFSRNFINEIVNLIYQENRSDYSRLAIVFSGKRPFLYLQKYLSQKIQAPHFPPTMFSIDTFIDYIVNKAFPDLREMEFLDAVRLLYKFWPDKQWDFGRFYSWGIKLLNFINQIDTEDVDNAKLRNIQNNAMIGFDIPESINKILQDIVVIREDFHKEMEQTHVFTRGYRYLKSKQIIQDVFLEEFDKIYFTGLFGLTETTKFIINELYQQNKAEIIWNADDVNQWEIFKEQANYFKSEIIPLKKGNNKTPEIHLYSCYDMHSQVIKTNDILQQNKPLKEISVVLPNADVLFPLLSLSIDRLPETDFNVSLSYPVNRTSLFSLIRDILACQESARIKNGEVFYYAKDYLKVITNPFIKNLNHDRESIQLIEQEINQKGLPFISLKQIKLIPEVHQLVFYELEGITNLDQSAGVIEKILDYILEHSLIRSYVLSGEVFQLFFQELAKIKQCSFAHEILSQIPVGNKYLINLIILNYLQTQVIPFDTKPLQDLEMIGFLETRNLNFNHVVILNMEEGTIPVEKEIEPLVPLGVYEQLGLPSIKYNEEMYRYYFYRLIQGAATVDLLYIENDEKKRSRYIEQIIWEKEKQEKQLDILKPVQTYYKINLMARHHDEQILKNDTIHQKLLKQVYSSTAIDDFLQCQFKFYYKYMLHIRRQKSITGDVEILDRGTIIHSVLRKTFATFYRRVISPGMLQELKHVLFSVLNQELENKVSVSGEYYIFKQIAQYKLKQFLASSLSQHQEEFSVVELEKEYQGDYETKFGRIKLKGKIDRVDKLEKQTYYYIVDYKTGSSQNQKRYKAKHDFNEYIHDFELIRKHVPSFQLPLYLSLFLSNNPAISFNQVNARWCYLEDNRVVDLFHADNSSDENREIQKNYKEALLSVLHQICDQQKPFVLYEDRNCCYCELKDFCNYKVK